nr:unnamed protein product [Callosobruchus chinensis]
MHGRRIRSRVSIPSTLNELKHALLEEWDLIPQEDIRHLNLGKIASKQSCGHAEATLVIKNCPAQFLLAMLFIFQ